VADEKFYKAQDFASYFNTKLQAENANLEDRLRACAVVIDTQDQRLARIAALETPNAAHGVKKAVRIAKGEEG
jgi:hypothetical protein